MRGWFNERFARGAARVLRALCLFVMVFYGAALVLTAMGRMSFTLHAPGGTVEAAIWADMPYDAGEEFGGGSLRFTLADDIHAWAGEDGRLSPGQKAGIALIAALSVAPLMAAYGALAGVLGRVGAGEIFTDANAHGLLAYGIIRALSALAVPFVKLGVCRIVSALGAGELAISTGQGMFGEIVPALGFLVAAYILHHGIHLQDEVDHTL